MGTEGLFTKACEETLVVLKRNAGALLTILSAVVADREFLTMDFSENFSRASYRLKLTFSVVCRLIPHLIQLSTLLVSAQ